MRKFTGTLLLCFAIFQTGSISGCTFTATNDAAGPDRCGKSAATAFLGPDALWRSRETLVFHLLDRQGGGFNLDVAVRDMNTYHQGERPALVWVVGPSGKTLYRYVLPDDGVVSGNAMYHDGIPDVFQDFRYREWHRAHSRGGYPPTKQRSPFLEHPEKIFARNVRVDVPDDGPGTYLLVLLGSWDHWFSVAPDRALPAGIHSGPGPLYVHKNQLAETYFFAPENTREVGMSVSEEIEPFNYRAVVERLDGGIVAATAPKTFLNYFVTDGVKGGEVYRLKITGNTTGACLHMSGLPALLCPDAATAQLLRGGTQIDARGRITFHGSQRRIFNYLDTLEPDDFVVAKREIKKDLLVARHARDRIMLSQLHDILDCQDLDPQSPTYGSFRTAADKKLEAATGFWNQKVDIVAQVAGLKDADNPYFGDAALVRRVLLCRAYHDLIDLTPYFWFSRAEGPREFKLAEDSFWGVPFRSSWVPMHDAKHGKSLGFVRDVVEGVIPADALSAWKEMFVQWTIARTLLHQGECTNQWASALLNIHSIYEIVDSPVIDEVLKFQLDCLTTKGNEGRVGPDPTPFAVRGKTAYTYAADSGYCGAGYMSDGLGHDAQYNLETTAHLCRLYGIIPHDGIIGQLADYYVLKTHLTMPKWGVATRNCFNETVSPTDSNHRTRCYTHGCPLPDTIRARIKYGFLWGGKGENRDVWPCLEEKSFVRNIDNEYYFLNTPAYYGIVFAGQANYSWIMFLRAVNQDNSVRLAGYKGMDYGGYGYKATKCAGLSAVFVRNCGPVLLSQNHNVMFSNNVWGRRRTPICAVWDEDSGVDGYSVASGYAQAYVTFDEENRFYSRVEDVRYAPLQVIRNVEFGDDGIVVTLNVIATGDLDLECLYECIPFMVEKRRVNTYGANLDAPRKYEIPPIVTTEVKPKRPYKAEHSGLNPKLASVTFRAFDVLAEKTDAGALVIFDREYEFMPTQPIRYRAEAAGSGAFNLKLPAKMKKGERVTIRYAVIPHQRALDAETIGAAAEKYFRR